MTYRCAKDPDTVLHLLVAREALPSSLGRAESCRWYRQLEGLLPKVVIEYQALQAPHYEWGGTIVQQRDPVAMLCTFKINCEPTDPYTTKAVQLMTKVRQTERTLLATAAVAAVLNSHAFMDALHCKLPETEGVSRKRLLRTAKLLVEQGDIDLFTKAFNTQSSNLSRSQQVNLAKGKLRKIAKFTRPPERTRQKKRPRKAKQGQNQAREHSMYNRTRLSLSMQLGCNLGVLLGKNAFSILERHFCLNRTRKPSWCSNLKEHSGQSAGSLWGPGAHSGLNAMGGKLPPTWIKRRPGLSIGGGASSVADMESDFVSSPAWCARLRRKLRAIASSYAKQARRRARQRSVLEGLAKAAGRLAGRTDCGVQFLYCEVGKLTKAAISWSKRYRRDRDLADVNAEEADSEDFDDIAGNFEEEVCIDGEPEFDDGLASSED